MKINKEKKIYPRNKNSSQLLRYRPAKSKIICLDNCWHVSTSHVHAHPSVSQACPWQYGGPDHLPPSSGARTPPPVIFQVMFERGSLALGCRGYPVKNYLGASG